MSGEVSDARARSLQREADRVKAREERKLEAERRRAARKNSGDDDAPNPLDAMANAGWDRKEYNARQKAKAASSSSSSNVTLGPDGQLSKEDQTIAYAEQLQSENQATLKNTIKVARETTVVGAATIHKLNDQTEQFQRMDNALVETGDTLSRSERILRGMKSWGGAISQLHKHEHSNCFSLPSSCAHLCALSASPPSFVVSASQHVHLQQAEADGDQLRSRARWGPLRSREAGSRAQCAPGHRG